MFPDTYEASQFWQRVPAIRRSERKTAITKRTSTRTQERQCSATPLAMHKYRFCAAWSSKPAKRREETVARLVREHLRGGFFTEIFTPRFLQQSLQISVSVSPLPEMGYKWSGRDLNSRPLHCERSALSQLSYRPSRSIYLILGIRGDGVQAGHAIGCRNGLLATSATIFRECGTPSTAR